MRKNGVKKMLVMAACLGVFSFGTTVYSQPVQVEAATSSGGTQWYENTGITIPAGYTVNYSQYHMLSTIQKGDIVYESKAGYGISGHIAIVEGIFQDEATQQTYIRLVEANTAGTYRSILDDSWVSDAGVHIYRVNKATASIIDGAVKFCIGELGSSYNLDFDHDHSASETNWYCSELVWAAYYNQGIDIETTGWLNEPGITPRDISRSSAVTEINFK